VLVAGGTGFAPIWSIADAAMREWSERKLVVVVGARELESLYMIPALCRLARCPNVTIVPVVQESQSVSPALRSGFPTDHIPPMSAEDIVYTCGAPPMVEKVQRMAIAAGAKCYCDPFEAATDSEDENGLLSRAMRWFTSAPEMPPTTHIAAQSQKQGPIQAQQAGQKRTPAPQRVQVPRLQRAAAAGQRSQQPPKRALAGPAQRAQGPRREPKDAARLADLARYAPSRARNKPAWLRQPGHS